MVVPVLGLSTVSTPGIEKTEKTTESQDVLVITLKCHHITPMLDTSSTISSSSSLPSKSASYPVAVLG